MLLFDSFTTHHQGLLREILLLCTPHSQPFTFAKVSDINRAEVVTTDISIARLSVLSSPTSDLCGSFVVSQSTYSAGADDGTRIRMVLPRDFKSLVSAYSTTSAYF